MEDLLSSSNYWLVAADSLRDFHDSVAALDIPIDSNLLVYTLTGHTDQHLQLWDVYRAQPGADLRSVLAQIVLVTTDY